MDGGLRGGLFGFNRRDVRRILADRERMFVEAVRETQVVAAKLADLEREIEPLREERHRATERADRAEGDLTTVQAELGPLREDLAAKEREIASLRGQIDELRSSVERLQGELDQARRDPMAFLGEAGDLPVKLLVAEIAPILEAAQQSAARLIDDARRHAEGQLTEIVRIRDEVRSHLGQIAAWRTQLDPMVEGVRSGLFEARARIDDVPNRVHAALAPVAGLIGDLAEQLDRFAQAVEPPSLSVPVPAPDPDVIDIGGPDPVEPVVIQEDAGLVSDPRNGGSSHVDSRILAAVPPTLRRYWMPQAGSGQRIAR